MSVATLAAFFGTTPRQPLVAQVCAQLLELRSQFAPLRDECMGDVSGRVDLAREAHFPQRAERHLEPEGAQVATTTVPFA